MADLDHDSVLWHTLFALAFVSWLVLLGSAQLALVVCVFLFILVPLVFRYSYTLQRSMLFLNFVRWPRNFNYSATEKVGLPGVRNFFLTTDKNIQLGIWQILPASSINDSKSLNDDQEWFESQLKDGKPVILYMHGNSGSRAAAHRVELYKVLRNLDYHVVAFDYRSYGDSSPVEPSEEGLVDDGIFVYRWLEKLIRGGPLFVWGHSLGTGVSSHALAVLSSEGTESFGLVLESPFNNMRDELRGHPFAQVFKFLPWFESCFVWPLYQNGLKFDTDENVSKILAPIAILHAEDDRIVPFYLGERLYHTIQRRRSKHNLGVEFVRYPAKNGYGHKYIYKDPSLPDTIRNFVLSSIRKHGNLTLHND